MKDILKHFLFSKQIIVGNTCAEHPAEVLFLFAKYYGIRITDGAEYADDSVVPFVAHMLGEDVPEPFYKGFPESVKELTPNEKFLDQLIHYAITYGLGKFDKAGHSVVEDELQRAAFAEHTEVKTFAIAEEASAKELIFGILDDMLKNTRPLSEMQFSALLAAMEEYGYEVKTCACKNTALRLILALRDDSFAKFINLSDVIKFVDMLTHAKYSQRNDIYNLNLCNQDRKLITKLIDKTAVKGKLNLTDCFEKKAVWCGLLHHLHYKPKNKDAEEFVAAMRGKGNKSVFSSFEGAIAEGDIKGAADILLKGKGNGALLRNIGYILSRAQSGEDKSYVLGLIDTSSPIILIQLLIHYSLRKRGARTFLFYRYNMLETHTETEKELSGHKSVPDEKTEDILIDFLKEKLATSLHGKLGSVYIDKKMYDIALPIQENTSNGGHGVLPKGSRIHIGADKKVRAFAYWEKVNDLDLSVIGIGETEKKTEFSWRTLRRQWKDGITFSGDQTAGYYGGSEYFDIDIPVFRESYPEIKYLIVGANVYSDMHFKDCICRAGYMLRDRDDSGCVFEPKTVASSFTVNCDSQSAHMFGLELETGDLVWLNTSTYRGGSIAVLNDLSFLKDYFSYTKIINLGTLFEILATKLTDNVAEADVALTDDEVTLKDGAEQIHRYDFEKVMALLN